MMSRNLDYSYRKQLLENLSSVPHSVWDVAIVGGGAAGLGCALDAASRGFKTILIEKGDIAQSTSSKSTKLIHGGVRYLAQGNILLVKEALKERGILLENASHIVHKKKFIIPVYSYSSLIWYGIGLKIYDLLSGKWSLGKSQMFTRAQALPLLDGINKNGLRGAVTYWDGQFDDTRLAVSLMRTIADHGGEVITYCACDEFIFDTNGKITGVKCKDQISGNSFLIHAKVVINATGVFTDQLQQKADASLPPTIKASKGVHIVTDKKILSEDIAMLIPQTSDGRVLFAVPWHNKVIIGTTDTPEKEITENPKVNQEDIDYILKQWNQYAEIPLKKEHIKSVFAGLRPLAIKGKEGKQTKEISRGHQVIISNKGLISIIGGKWTTYRKMGEDVLDMIIESGLLKGDVSHTKTLRIHGRKTSLQHSFSIYGTDADEIIKMIEIQPDLGKKIHPELPYIIAEVIWCVRNEMVMKLEDVLSRRLRCLLLDAQATVSCAKQVAEMMAQELGKDEIWIEQQIKDFYKTAEDYQVNFNFE
jgi:glycerol-3-phosphate dehydrogenase